VNIPFDADGYDEARDGRTKSGKTRDNLVHAINDQVAILSDTTADKSKRAETHLTQDYVDAAKPVVEKQLERGGVRLAMVLNKALRCRLRRLLECHSEFPHRKVR
jgi:hypothetical protein